MRSNSRIDNACTRATITPMVHHWLDLPCSANLSKMGSLGSYISMTNDDSYMVTVVVRRISKRENIEEKPNNNKLEQGLELPHYNFIFLTNVALCA